MPINLPRATSKPSARDRQPQACEHDRQLNATIIILVASTLAAFVAAGVNQAFARYHAAGCAARVDAKVQALADRATPVSP